MSTADTIREAEDRFVAARRESLIASRELERLYKECGVPEDTARRRRVQCRKRAFRGAQEVTS